jgi:hypothetical protein
MAIGGSLWNCICECGKTTVVKIGKLTMGLTKSCGCFRRENTEKLRLSHGHARVGRHTDTYERWKQILQRCENPKNKGFRRYGGRGIKVVPRWRSYENFLFDMGEAPKGSLLDRINNDGNYEPGNCRWTDPVTSARNRRPRQKV